MQCLTDFVDAQLNYYNSCTKTLQDLSRQIGGMGIVSANRNLPPPSPKSPQQTSSSPSGGESNNSAAAAANASSFSALNGGNVNSGSSTAIGLSPNFTNKKTAKVLFDYEATDPSEMSVSANQVTNISNILLNNL